MRQGPADKEALGGRASGPCKSVPTADASSFRGKAPTTRPMFTFAVVTLRGGVAEGECRSWAL